VRARAGGILPLQAEEEVSARTDNPTKLELLVFCGADGDFTMYEDDGVSMDYEDDRCVTTRYALNWADRRLVIEPAEGDLSLIPKKRQYTVKLYGVGTDSLENVLADGEPQRFETSFDAKRNVLSVALDATEPTARIELLLRKDIPLADNNIVDNAYELLNRAQVAFQTKESLFRLLKAGKGLTEKLSTIHSTYMDEGIRQAVTELLTAW